MIIPTTTQQKKTFEVIKVSPGLYDATFKEAKELKDGKYGKRIGLLFEFKSGIELITLAFPVFTKYPASQGNKLGKALVALGGKIDGSNIDLDKHLGTKVRIYVKDFDKEIKHEDGTNEKVKSSYIEDIMPLA